MRETLVVTVEQRRSGASVIKLAGVLDEHNQLGELTEKVGAGTALINLSGVERINSIGTRDWVNWLASLEARGIQPVLVACSPAIVAQLNRVKNFVGNGVVKSVQVPYHCAACGQKRALLVHVAQLGAPPHHPPPCACEACDAQMTVDDESGAYFAFVRSLPKPKLAPKHESGPDLALGSDAAVTSGSTKRTSEPRLPARASSPYLSAFQVGRPATQPGIALDRTSQRELGRAPVAAPTERPYLIAIVGLLVCAVAVLAFLLLR
ncbi:MAG: anti-sigma factor antagonist [Myxococcales bacterium]|nr:anti-sigma factor antagonist [Myxococcales bacterium]